MVWERLSLPEARKNSAFRPWDYLLAILLIAAAGGIRFLLQRLSLWDAPLLLLTAAVCTSGIAGGLGPGLLAAALGSLLWHHFFPIFVQPGFGLLFMGMGGIAVLSSLLATERRKALASDAAMRRSESRFRGITQANVIGVACGAPGGAVIEANDAFLEMTGYSREDLGAGAICWDETVGVSPAPAERDLARKDGERIPALLYTAALGAPEGEVVALVVDLTERKLLEQKLRQRQKLETVGLLAAGVAHDFNNLLTSILMNAQLSRDALPAGHRASKMLDDIMHESMRAGCLTSQLLAYAGKGSLFSKSVDLAAAIREGAAIAQSSMLPEIELRLELDADLIPIEADAGQIQQFVANLIANASEAIGEGHAGEIVVSASSRRIGHEGDEPAPGFAELSPGYYAMICVRDNGCGMDAATTARAFDPFFTTKFLGRGLGLSAAQGIVRAHGGAIRIVSAPGKGTTVEALLPMPAAKAASQAAR